MPAVLRAELAEKKAARFQENGRFQKAFAHYLDAHCAYQSAHDLYGQLTTALKLGDALRQLEAFTAARGWYGKAAQLVKRQPTALRKKLDAFKWDAECGQALCRRGEGKWSEAIRLLSKCHTHYQQAQDRAGMAYTLWALGTTERFAGRLKPAVNHLKRSIKLYLRLKDRDGCAYARCGLGGSYRMQGLARQSERLYKNANTHFRKTGDFFGQAYSFCGQGNAARLQGDFQKARMLMARAEKLYRRLNQKGPLGFVLWSRAQLDILLRQFPRAAKRLKDAEKLFRRTRDFRGLLYCQLGRAELARAQAKPQAAPLYRGVMVKARRLHLPFEKAHARFRLDGSRAWNLYRSSGVRLPFFRRYRSLP